MAENNQKGWHGSYSVAGKVYAERFPMILQKDEILKCRFKKKRVKDYFATEENFDDNKILVEDKEDIFSNKYKSKISLKKKHIDLCQDNINKKLLSQYEDYKYHLIHHQYSLDYKMKNSPCLNSTAYDPKRDLITPKTICGPKWNFITGRERGGLFSVNIEPITKNDKQCIYNYPKNGVPMEKLTQRGIIPTHYDFRIRTEKPFLTDPNKREDTSTTEKQFSQSTNDSNISLKNKNQQNLLNLYLSKDVNHSIDFSKILSREKYNNARAIKQTFTGFLNPKYDLVEPRTITMMSYKKKKQKPKNKRFLGLNIDSLYQKEIFQNDKHNNAINYQLMSKKVKNDKLPLYMQNISNRNSMGTFSEKALNMNNFAGSDFKNDYSSFCRKKSFNRVINKELLKISKIDSTEVKLHRLLNMLNKNRKVKGVMEYYLKNFDNNITDYTGNKFDGVTYESM
jgi:hypothetical protein